MIRPAAVFVGALVLCLAGVVVLTLEALEERKGAVAAADLRLAVITVAAVEDLTQLDPVGRERYRTSLEALNADVEPALHALEPSEAERARQWIDELRSRAQQTRDGEVNRADAASAAD